MEYHHRREIKGRKKELQGRKRHKEKVSMGDLLLEHLNSLISTFPSDSNNLRRLEFALTKKNNKRKLHI